MRHPFRAYAVLCLCVFLAAPCTTTGAGEIAVLDQANWDELVPQGKEVDCIYGDYVLRNKHLVAVIAQAVKGRNANMTVRDVGGAVIDLTVRDRQSDQLSAYYPLGGRYELAPVDGPDFELAADLGGVFVSFSGPAKEGATFAKVWYRLRDNARWLEITTRITNKSDKPLEIDLADTIRADGEFEFGGDDELRLFWAYDPYWRQAYGTVMADAAWRVAGDKSPGRRGSSVLRLEKPGEASTVPPGKSLEVVRYLIPAANTIDVRALAAEIRGKTLSTVNLNVRDPDGPVAGADVTVTNKAGEPVAHGKTDKKGRLVARFDKVPDYAVVSAQGRGEKKIDLKAAQPLAVELPAPGYVAAAITDSAGGPIPCKVQFRARGDTPSPNFGPDSAIHGVRNLYYTENGKFRVPLAPGEYDVIVSHGPEFDAVFTTLTVERGQEAKLAAELKRTVDTAGWLSADFHSHSTPSGDNTASQRGRVLNLLAEHIEFAPCTEHNRITVYDEHIAHFKAAGIVLSCPGMELTGTPLPINHQNAFPLVPHVHTQDGGAPLTDVDPVVQIERLAMWDGGSDKLVQINHPNLPQIVGDRDKDGSPDVGFEKMFSFMDVVEVHPLDRIFYTAETLDEQRKDPYAVFSWLQLMNLGYRIPGVVNTDAHWNFHGSGFLRNYIKSSIDEPAKNSVAELVHTCEHGRIMLTNGPFMEVTAASDKGKAEVGDDLAAPGGKLRLKIRVQCPNWLEVNRVQVFVNGKQEPKWNFTQRTHPAMFKRATVIFDQEVPIELASDAHLVVACAGEGKGLGDVMGPDHAKDMPTAVGNPIFVDVDGDGFKPNGDQLGLPLPLPPDLKPSKPHKHEH
jgi:hypothetical protein